MEGTKLVLTGGRILLTFYL